MKTLIASSLIALLASSTIAQEAGDVSVAVGVSSLGANIEGAYRIDESYRVRGAFIGGISVDYEESDEDGDFEGEFDLGGLTLIGDFYPMQGGWRISGGLFFSNSELSATGTAEIDVPPGTVAATTEASFINDVSPMITTGYDLALGAGWSFNSEAGIIFTGGIEVDYTADDPALQDELDNDPDLQDVKDDAEDITIYPYVSLTVSYQF